MVDYSPDSVIIHLLFDIYQINSIFFCGYGQLEEKYPMLKNAFQNIGYYWAKLYQKIIFKYELKQSLFHPQTIWK